MFFDKKEKQAIWYGIIENWMEKLVDGDVAGRIYKPMWRLRQNIKKGIS